MEVIVRPWSADLPRLRGYLCAFVPGSSEVVFNASHWVRLDPLKSTYHLPCEQHTPAFHCVQLLWVSTLQTEQLPSQECEVLAASGTAQWQKGQQTVTLEHVNSVSALPLLRVTVELKNIVDRKTTAEQKRLLADQELLQEVCARTSAWYRAQQQDTGAIRDAKGQPRPFVTGGKRQALVKGCTPLWMTLPEETLQGAGSADEVGTLLRLLQVAELLFCVALCCLGWLSCCVVLLGVAELLRCAAWGG